MFRIYLLGTLFLLFSCSSDSLENLNSKNTSGTKFKKISVSQSSVEFVNKLEESNTMNHFIWDYFYNGGGVAVGDLNNDGLPDIVFTSFFEKDAIYINKGDMEFEDISVKSGIHIHSNRISSGVTLVDINNDGYLDISVAKFGYSDNPGDKKNLFFLNNKDLTFKEVAGNLGIDQDGFSFQTSFFDYDKDGDLDLYIMNQPSNVRSVREVEQKNLTTHKRSPYQNERNTDRLYRNNGNMSFTDVSKEAGIDNFGYGLGVVIADVNQDGWSDIYISTDLAAPDNLYINNQDGTFTDKAKEAFKHTSNFAMGADISDINNDGLPDIGSLDMAGANHYRSKTNMAAMRPKEFWSAIDRGLHYQYMHNTLQLNNGNETFSEVGNMLGIAKTDWSWSILFDDLDNDGWEDIFITNGTKKDVRNNDWRTELKSEIKDGKMSYELLLKYIDLMPSVPMPNYLFQNTGKLKFKDVSESWGFGEAGFSNGAAIGDLDLDGDLDIVINNVNKPASIYQNQAKGNSYLRIKLSSSKSKRPVLNSKITVYADGKKWTKELLNSRGYQSMSEPILHFGLGKSKKIDKIEILWPDNNISEHTDISINTLASIDQDKIKKIRKHSKPLKKNQYLIETYNKVNYEHQENQYDDYQKQVLLPYKQSEFGPTLSAADINGDGLDDIYIGGSTGQKGSILLQQSNGSFQKKSSSAFSEDKKHEDTGSIFFDADGDADMDLYVVSGGYEFDKDSENYQDRLYLNDGIGNFSKSTSKLPKITFSGKAIAANDVDGDGDIDIFVGGKLVPGEYPKSPKSLLLINEKGKFIDKTSENANELLQGGMITRAIFSDYDGDNDEDLIVTGEWMHPTIYNNTNGEFKEVDNLGDMSSKYGLWFGLTEMDVDNDGDMDYLAGNIGLNNKYKASEDKPFWLYANDFDSNGNYDIVLANYTGDQLVPLRGRECSSEQVPEVSEKFTTFDGFAKASLDQIYDLNSAQNLKATDLRSGVFINNGGSFNFKEFDPITQISPINDFITMDINKDGQLDILAGGNLYGTEVETTRFDAGIGVTMLGDGKGNFKLLDSQESGFFISKDVKDLQIIDGNKILVGNNNDVIQLFKLD